MAASATQPEGGAVEIIASPTALEAISRADFDVQISTAKRFPMHGDARGLQRFKEQSIMMATMDRETAESCMYAVPRAGNMIEGRSVRLAEIIVAAYGNVKALARIIETTDKEVVAQGVCHDLESNVSTSVEVRRRITNKQGHRYSDDMIQTTSNAACAIAYRNAVYKVVPAALCDPAYRAAKKMAVGDVQSIEIRRPKALNMFALMGISQDRVLARLGRVTTADVNIDDMATLTGIRNAIKSGEITVDEAFPNVEESPPTAPGARSDALADKIKGEAPEAPKAPARDLPDAEPTTVAPEPQSAPEPPKEQPPAESDGTPEINADLQFILDHCKEIDMDFATCYEGLKREGYLSEKFPFKTNPRTYTNKQLVTLRAAITKAAADADGR